MVYALFRPGFDTVAFLETWDGEVTDAPSAWRWTIGKPVPDVLSWAFEHEFDWKVAVRH